MWKGLCIRLRLDWSLNWLTSLWQAWATHCLTFQDARQYFTTPPPPSGMTHTNEKLFIMTPKRLACHEVRINLEPRGMH